MVIISKKAARVLVWITAAVMVVCGCLAFVGSAYATDEKPGLAIIGDNVNGDKGFKDNIKYLTETQIENAKSNKSVAGLGLGDSYKIGLRFSSYEQHGTGSYHYILADGIDINTMLGATVTGGIGSVNNYYVIAADGYTQNMAVSSLTGLKYYAPGDSTGVLSPEPILALYETSNQTSAPSLGQIPISAARLAAGENVFLFGQTGIKDSNNCKFLKEANTICVNSIPVGIKSSSRPGSETLPMLMQMGIEKKQYTFTDNGSTVTHKVEGCPLSKVTSDLGIDTLMPAYANYKLQVVSTDGSVKNIAKSDIAKSFIAWNYYDGMATPAKQTNEYMIYMPGKTAETSIAYNVSKINVVSASGKLVTEKTYQPKTPEGFTASASSYNSVRLKWNKTEGAAGYMVYRYDAAAKQYKQIKTTTGFTYTDNALKTGTKYTYRVRTYGVANGDKIYGSYTVAASARPALKTGKINKLTKSGKTAIKVRISKVSGATGYQIVYGTNKKITKSKKTVNITKGSVTSKTLKKLKKGKKYYFKTRAYRVVNGSKVYGGFSKVKALRR